MKVWQDKWRDWRGENESMTRIVPLQFVAVWLLLGHSSHFCSSKFHVSTKSQVKELLKTVGDVATPDAMVVAVGTKVFLNLEEVRAAALGCIGEGGGAEE